MPATINSKKLEVALCMAVGLCLLGAASGVPAQTTETQAKSLARYEPYLGKPVDQFHFWRLQGWELVGNDKLVVFPEINEAYLLTVDQPCSELQWAKAVGLSSTANTVNARFDSVDVGRQKCRIMEIRPIDIKAYKKDRRAAKPER